MHSCAERQRSARLRRYQTAPNRFSILIVIVLYEMSYSSVQTAAALAELLFTAAERRSRIWLQLRGTLCPELSAVVGLKEDETDREGTGKGVLKTTLGNGNFHEGVLIIIINLTHRF